MERNSIIPKNISHIVSIVSIYKIHSFLFTYIGSVWGYRVTRLAILEAVQLKWQTLLLALATIKGIWCFLVYLGFPE